MNSAEQDKKRTLADESPKTRKAREKLKRQFDALEKKVTPQALAKQTLEIQRWIARHASTRVTLKSKSISLFDENQNAARLSQRVSQIAEQIKKDFHPESAESEQENMSKLKKLVSSH